MIKEASSISVMSIEPRDLFVVLDFVYRELKGMKLFLCRHIIITEGYHFLPYAFICLIELLLKGKDWQCAILLYKSGNSTLNVVGISVFENDGDWV